MLLCKKCLAVISSNKCLFKYDIAFNINFDIGWINMDITIVHGNYNLHLILLHKRDLDLAII